MNQFYEEEDRREKMKPFWNEHLEMTRLLCEICRKIEANNEPVSQELKSWWDKHKASDGHEP